MSAKPEIPPCKYPVGTRLKNKNGPGHSPLRIKSARLAWVYDTSSEEGFYEPQAVSEAKLAENYICEWPGQYGTNTKHRVGLGLLGVCEVEITNRNSDTVWFLVEGTSRREHVISFAEFEKAVVK